MIFREGAFAVSSWLKSRSTVSGEVAPHANRAGGAYLSLRTQSLSSRIVADVRQALLDRQLTAGDVVGTEKDLAAQYGVSRVVARDALRSLQALGVAEVRMGKGGGARIAKGNPMLLAEALAIQLDLMGARAEEVIDAQRAIECMAAELAALHATRQDHANIERLLVEAQNAIDQRDQFTRLSHAFHFAIAEASHNRVLVVQLVSLDHVAWPLRNTTLTPAVARRVLDVHRQLADLITIRDAAGARQLMNDHVNMIRARRTSERTSASSDVDNADGVLWGCC